MQDDAPESLVAHLITHLDPLESLHGDHPSGCMGACEDMCAQGLPGPLHPAVPRPCVDRCRAVCADAVAYHDALVTSLLHLTGDARAEESPHGAARRAAVAASAAHVRRLFDLPEFAFHIGGKKENSNTFGNSDVGLVEYEPSHDSERQLNRS